MNDKKVAYCYLKGKYNYNKFYYEGDELLKEIDKTFNSFDEMVQWIASFSNYYSIPVQFYY